MNCAYPGFIEICGIAGFDFAVIDLEHGPLNILVAEDLCRAADYVGIAPLSESAKMMLHKFNALLILAVWGYKFPK